MENINLEPQTMERIMTSSKLVDMYEFLSIILRSEKVHEFAKKLTSDHDLFVKLITHQVGSKRFKRILGISKETDTILFDTVKKRYTEIMTHERGYDLASWILKFCDLHLQESFCCITHAHALALACDEYGSIILKKVITLSKDGLKSNFLHQFAVKGHFLNMDALVTSSIQHMLKLDYTHKTTQDNKPLHNLMAEFDEILKTTTSDIEELHRLVSRLTSDYDLFVDFIKTDRGSLMAHIILGKSEEIDTMFLEAIEERFTDVITVPIGYSIVMRTINVSMKAHHQIQSLVGEHALYLTKNVPRGNFMVQKVINLNNLEYTASIVLQLHRHYVELSFLKHGSNVVEKLLGDSNTLAPLVLTVMEIVNCDEDTLVRLAKDEYGNRVLKKAFEVAKEHKADLFDDLVDKFLPFLDSLCESLGENIVAIILERLMTSCEEVDMNKFLRIVSRTNELHKFVNMLSDLDRFVKLITHQVGSERFMRIFGISEEINTILFEQVMTRFIKIMTHESGCDLASRILNVCSIDQKQRFWHVTFENTFNLAQYEHGCSTLKKVMTLCEDRYKNVFLYLIAVKAYWLISTKNDLGISLIQHVLNLDYTRETTQDDTRLHDLMAEFDEILSTISDIIELHSLALELTSDSDLFVDFIKRRRGSLMAQIIIGRSEVIDTVFLEAIKQRFTDVITSLYNYRIVLRVMDVFKKRGDMEVYDEILHLVGVHALHLTKDPSVGYKLVLDVINLNDLKYRIFIAHNLQHHYIELSFLTNGSKVMEKLVGDRLTMLPLLYMVKEIVESDEDTLVRLARDENGNRVLKKTLEIAKKRVSIVFGDLVDKLMPILDRMWWSIGVNIAPIIDPETKSVKG